jgi:hypothetical protein
MKPYLLKESLTATLSCTIRSASLATPLQNTLPDDFTFRQDSGPKHKAKATRKHLDEHAPSWPSAGPPQSAALSTTENCRALAAKCVDGQAPTTMRALKLAINKACKVLPMASINACVDHMGERCCAVIKPKRGPTCC